MILRRATDGDFDALLALQQAAYEENGKLLGATPMPLQADYKHILRDMEDRKSTRLNSSHIH